MTIKADLKFTIVLDNGQASSSTTAELMLWSNARGRIGIQVKTSTGQVFVSTEGEKPEEFGWIARVLG